MYLQLFLVLFATALSSAQYNSPIHLRFSSGENTSIKRFPHAVYVLTTPSRWSKFIYWNFACGGTLIKAKWVLTVASCMFNSDYDKIKTELIRVIAGREYIHGPLLLQNGYDVDKMVFHEKFNPQDERYANFYNIGLFRLKNEVRSCCSRGFELINNSNVTLSRTKLHAAGWGSTGIGDEFSRQIRVVEFAPWSDTTCLERFGFWLYNELSLFCGQYQSQRQPCRGDSGAGLIWSVDEDIWTLAGMVMWHNGSDCSKQYPNTGNRVVRISHFESWIREHAY